MSEFNFKLGLDYIVKTDKYRYLGRTINEFLDSSLTGNTMAEGALRALGKLLSKYYANKGLDIKTYQKLFDCCIIPIMDIALVCGGTNRMRVLKGHKREQCDASWVLIGMPLLVALKVTWAG